MKKVILTEEQFNSLVLEMQVAQLLQEALNESKNIDNLKNTIKKCLMAGVAAAAIITAIQHSGLPNKEVEILTDMVNQNEMVDSTFINKVNDCEEYMKWALANQGFSLESTGLKAETMVKVSEETGISLAFIMAVANLESCFGATKLARKTNSVFSEGLWSDGTIHRTFDDPNDSVYGFANLMNTHYFVDGKDESSLLDTGCFVNDEGHRYAQDPNYEKKVKSIVNRIINKYPRLT